MESIKVIENLEKYFNAKAIGSFLFVRAGLLEIEDINDIDISVHPDVINNVYKYLEDLGYSQTIKQGKQIGYEEKAKRVIYEQLPQGDFKRKGQLNIDVIVSVKDVYSIPTLIAEKYKRGKKSDFEQLIKIVGAKSETYRKLMYHKNTTVGLYAIDKDPKKVDIDWIRKNSFRIDF